MSLPAPNLDDRRFQDLVDDAKRLVQQRCPEWTDHNVSDPGVTLIEAFAFMTDQLLYRLNRVPDRLYVKFLELIGVRLFPASVAGVDVTFWLSAPQPGAVSIPPGTQVATLRTARDEAVVFTTCDELRIPSLGLDAVATSGAGADEPVRRSDALPPVGRGFACFNAPPLPGDALLIGLDDAAPSCAVGIRFDCPVDGVGVDPRDPPLRWEAWDGDSWVACELDRDTTGGLNRAGDVVVHVPPTHRASYVGGSRAGWLRCVVLTPQDGQPFYSETPYARSIEAFVMGATTRAMNAEPLPAEELGRSTGTPSQRFILARKPVVQVAEGIVLEVTSGDGWEEWRRVETFDTCGSHDPVFVLDPVSGEVHLGPMVRLPDGSNRQLGAVPPRGAMLRLRHHGTGGGARGNVREGALRVLKSSIPYVSHVENRSFASGGADGEDIDNAKVRGPMLLRTRSRAVTAEDYVALAREIAPEMARIDCRADEQNGGVHLLVVPQADGDDIGRLALHQLEPVPSALQRLTEGLDAVRVLGTRLLVRPPDYQGVTVTTRLQVSRRSEIAKVESAALAALYEYLHPLRGGPAGDGWPFGRPVRTGDLFALLQAVPGVRSVEDLRLYGADPLGVDVRGPSTSSLDVAPDALVFSTEHLVRVEVA
jgi:predicted phage baseplate assembly protein